MSRDQERRSASAAPTDVTCQVRHSNDHLRNHQAYWTAYRADFEAFAHNLVPDCNYCGIIPDFCVLEHLSSDAINFNTIQQVINFSDGV